jgi:hypothetical protein
MEGIGAAAPIGASMPVTPISSYKARKEAFVSDLSGGSILEINLVTLVAPVSHVDLMAQSETSLSSHFS